MVAAGADVLSVRVDTGLEIPTSNEPPVRPEIFIYTVILDQKDTGVSKKRTGYNWLHKGLYQTSSTTVAVLCGMCRS